MIRIVNCALVLITGMISLGVYRVAEEARMTAMDLRDTRAATLQENRSLTVLGAEWAHLTQPARIQALAERYLRLSDRPTARLTSLRELPPKFAPRPEDAIRNANVVIPQSASPQRPLIGAGSAGLTGSTPAAVQPLPRAGT